MKRYFQNSSAYNKQQFQEDENAVEDICQRVRSSSIRRAKEKSGVETARQPYDTHGDDDYSRATGQERSPAVVDTLTPVQNGISDYNKYCRVPENNQNDPLRTENGNTVSRNHNVVEEQQHDGDDMPLNQRYTTNQSYDNNNNYKMEYGNNKSSATESNNLRGMPPLATAYCSPQIAKNLAVENLKHHPLPDTVEDALYRSMQLNRDGRHPGRSLDVAPRAAAIGCKGYGAPGPTQCSKLKVYRPKTAGAVLPSGGNRTEAAPPRPKTSDRLSREKKYMSQMQLALCWDLKPPDPLNEPKRSPHVDGSNGSAAPAVFAMVHPADEKMEPVSAGRSKQHGNSHVENSLVSNGHRKPRRAWEERESRGRVTNPSAVMDIVNNYEVQTEPIMGNRRRSNSSKENTPPSPSSFERQENIADIKKTGKRNGSAESDKSKIKHHQSTPDLSNGGSGPAPVENNNLNSNAKSRLLNNRPCMACEMKTSTSSNNSSNMKLRNTNNNNNNANASPNVSTINSISSIRSNNKNNDVHVPKPRTPYAKRSYSIGTLAPPFSLWPGTTGQDYPEHWRLASVYQHSYRPIESRRKTFLKSVYQ